MYEIMIHILLLLPACSFLQYYYSNGSNVVMARRKWTLFAVNVYIALDWHTHSFENHESHTATE